MPLHIRKRLNSWANSYGAELIFNPEGGLVLVLVKVLILAHRHPIGLNHPNQMQFLTGLPSMT